MSKYVKNLIAGHLRERLDGVDAALLVNVIGLDANANNHLRAELQSKDINLMVIKNSLAARATEGTALSPMFVGLNGTAAICWGSEDVVSLAKEVSRLAGEEQYEAFEPRGGVMDGEPLTAEQVAAVSKWPTRTEQLSILLGQILSPGANLSGQLIGPGSALASQIEQRGEDDEDDEGGEKEGQEGQED
ncbi:MAG: 50S ribosomal protein L10 [Candidatus Nealsonbacteria bacterium]|nr:50S ribosomal protein L10 [Candidatus Nealsonbacteria bacterium]